jgi:hypothetical protein
MMQTTIVLRRLGHLDLLKTDRLGLNFDIWGKDERARLRFPRE